MFLGGVRAVLLLRAGLAAVAGATTSMAGRTSLLPCASCAQAWSAAGTRHSDIVPIARKRAPICLVPSRSGRFDACRYAGRDLTGGKKVAHHSKRPELLREKFPRHEPASVGTTASTVTPLSAEAMVSEPPSARMRSRIPVSPKPSL